MTCLPKHRDLVSTSYEEVECATRGWLDGLPQILETEGTGAARRRKHQISGARVIYDPHE